MVIAGIPSARADGPVLVGRLPDDALGAPGGEPPVEAPGLGVHKFRGCVLRLRGRRRGGPEALALTLALALALALILALPLALPLTLALALTLTPALTLP